MRYIAAQICEGLYLGGTTEITSVYIPATNIPNTINLPNSLFLLVFIIIPYKNEGQHKLKPA